MLQSKLSKNQKSLTLSREKMQQLIEDYWTANKSNRHKAFPQFWKNVNHTLKRYNCNCSGRHSCELRKLDHTTRPHCITTKTLLWGWRYGCFTSLTSQEWYSRYQEDQVFGAKHDFFKQDLSGKNTYINPPFNTFEDKHNLIEKSNLKSIWIPAIESPNKSVLIAIFEGEIGQIRLRQGNRAFWKLSHSRRVPFLLLHPNTITFITIFSLDTLPKK